MFKRIAVILMAAALAVGMVSCGAGNPNTDVQEVQEAADYEKFIKDNATGRFDKTVEEAKGDTAKERAEDYLASYDKGNVVIDEKVLDLYKDSFKAFFTDAELDDKALTEKATNMILREIAVYRAYYELKGEDIDTSNRDAMKKAAEEMAKEYGYNAEAIYTDGGSTYLVETYIRYAYVVSQFENGEDVVVESSEESESSVAEETSEASESSESVESSEASESTEASESSEESTEE